MEFTSHFLINFLVIVLSLLVIQFWMTKFHQKRTHIEIIFFISFTLSILFCMLFPFKVTNGLFFDLRLIPLILGCLYARRLTGLWLLVVMIFLRLFIGVTNSWFPISSSIVFFLVTLWLRPIYERLSKTGKISLSTTLMIVMSVFILLGDRLFLHGHISFSFCVSYICIQTGGMGVVVYMLESIIEQHLLFLKMVRMEKVELAGHLAASISHEVRNPLTSTRGFLQLISESDDIPPAEKNYLMIAMKELDRAEGIIQDYLTFARPVSSPERFEIIDVQREIEKAISILKPLANMNVVEILTDMEPCSIHGHPGGFQQALVNILKNGIEAMPSGGKLSIDARTEHSMVIIRVSDEGIGMSQVQIRRLGEPYYSTKDFKGTGLGMMVVFRIVESLDGTIHVESELGKGTTITLRFPSAI